MRMSKKGLDHLIESEGSRNHAYDDVAGYRTIGVGHLITDNEQRTGIIRINSESVQWRLGLSDDQVRGLLAQDVKRFEEAVSELVEVELNQNQFDALVNFVYNVGESAFKNSTLLRLLNRGEYRIAADEFSKWRRAGGRVIPGLIARRAKERELFLEPWVTPVDTVMVPKELLQDVMTAYREMEIMIGRVEDLL